MLVPPHNSNEPIDALSDQIQTLMANVAALVQAAKGKALPNAADAQGVFDELEAVAEELQTAQEELRQQHEMLIAERHLVDTQRQYYHQLYDLAPDSYLVTDKNGVIKEANNAASQLLKVPKQFLEGKPIAVFITGDQHLHFRSRLSKMSKLGDKIDMWELQLKPRNGTPIDVAVRVSAVYRPGGEVAFLHWLLRDITQEKLAEQVIRKSEERFRQLFEEVRTSREQLRVLSRRLVETQEQERRHLAHELHDEIGQLLTALKLTLEAAARLPPESIKSNIQQGLFAINSMISQIRTLSLNLHPAMLDDLGLLPALLWHFDNYTKQTNIRVNFMHSGLDGRFASDLETAVYRIIQESLTNVARHAHVDEVSVWVGAEKNKLHIQVEDQGVGFDPVQVMTNNVSYGLRGLRERISLLEGEFDLVSSPKHGTCLTITLPVT